MRCGPRRSQRLYEGCDAWVVEHAHGNEVPNVATCGWSLLFDGFERGDRVESPWLWSRILCGQVWLQVAEDPRFWSHDYTVS